jgi:hypothetical protein
MPVLRQPWPSRGSRSKPRRHAGAARRLLRGRLEVRRVTVLSVAVILAALGSGANLAAAQAAPVHSKPLPPRAIMKATPRSVTRGATVPVAGGRAGLPSHGGAPVALKPSAYKALHAAMRKPVAAPATRASHMPAHGRFTQLTGSASAAPGHAYWNGSRWVAPAGAKTVSHSLPRLLIPRAPTGQAGRAPASPQAFYSSTQVDSATAGCSNPFPNEASVAQSSDNPSDVVVAAQTYMDGSGNCADSQAWVFYSHDGGQHWREEIMPGLTAGLASGDVAVVYDPKDHVFVYSFLQFSRTTSTNSINVASSADGASWFDLTTLDSNAGALDKDMITVNQDTGSPDYGRVLVAWRDDAVGQNAFLDAFSDNGGGSWTGSSDSINIVPDCGNGVSPAFDANGDAMGAWFDCSSGNNIEEELSTNGGASWAQPNNTVISGVTDIGSGGPGSTACRLNSGGSAFRCDSFPSLAGDPNSSDAGGSAFVVVFANWESTTQSSVTANVSQLRGLSTVDGGSHWNGGSCCSFDYMAFKDFGDKFFPWAAFAPNGRLNVGYSDREGSASSGNPNGLSYNEGQTEASSLTALRADSFIAYTADGTLGNPGSLTFIGDYAGAESQDASFDTFPVWTDVRNGTADVRTMDLCYADCPSFLHPQTPVGVSRAGGSSFTDLYQFNTDPAFGGAGSDFWNAVGIREGTDGSSVDDDIGLWDSRYFSNRVAIGSFSPPLNDYVLENDNAGHGPTQPYFIDVHSFSSLGGSYAIEWASGHSVLGASLADSMAAGNVIRVYDMNDTTGTSYFLGLRPAGGNTSSYRMSVHLNGNGTYQGSGNESATTGNVAPGTPAFLTVNTGASPSGFDALVVQNNNGGSGSYTLYRDTAAPSGTITVNSGAAFTKSTSVTLNLSATNPTAGDPVLDMRFSTDGTTFGPWLPFAASAPFSLPSGDGAKTVFAEFRNGAGAVSPAVSDSITLDTTAPSITKAPAPAFVKGHVTSSGAPISVSWAATDATSGIGHYDLDESIDGGAYSLVASPATAKATVTLKPGHSYRFKVRATDNAGNVSGFTTGSAFTLSAVQETASAITYSSGWTKQTLTGSYGGSVKFATLAGKTAKFSFTGSQVAWVSTIGSNRGSATLSLDGGSAATVSTNGSTLQAARVVFIKTAASGTHSLLLKVLGTSGHPRVDVDAFLVIH